MRWKEPVCPGKSRINQSAPAADAAGALLLVRGSEQPDDQLRDQHHRDQRDGVGRGVGGGDVARARHVDEGAEGGGGGHAAGDGAKDVQQVHLQHMLGDDIAHDHRQKRHENAVDEVDGLEIPHEAHAARDARADQEDHQTKLPEGLQDLLARHKVGPAEVAEVAEHQRDQQRAARRGEREEIEEFHRAQQDAEHRRDGEGREAEIVELQQLSLELGDVAGLHMGDLAAFLVQIRVHDARHQLHEQHDADDAEEIRDAVADRDRVLILGGDGLLRGGKRRGRGQRACEQAGDHGRQLARVIARLPGLDGPADEQAQDRGEAAGEDDHHAQQHVGLEVVLHVLQHALQIVPLPVLL